MSNTMKVLRLKSGDCIIAEITENRKSHLKLTRPMEIKYMHFIDGMGRKHETMVLMDWLRSTTSNEVLIEKNMLIGIFQPNPDVIHAYSQQKNYDDAGGSSHSSGFSLDDLMNNIEKEIKKINKLSSMDEELDDEEDPSEEFIKNIINNKSNKKQQQEKIIDEEADPSYGSNYCDWSPDPKDYLS